MPLYSTPLSSGQETLEYLEHANLFIVPLDNERRWYRYHHLFAELLRQRLHQSTESDEGGVAELHIRASQWYEDNGLELEAFHHAAAANDVERAVRLMESKGMPLHLPGAATTDTELAGVAANDRAGCQALVVVEACFAVADVSAKRRAWKRNYKRLKQL